MTEVEITLPVFSEGSFAYQEIGPKALELMKLGMNYSQIAAQLQVSDKTVAKGIRDCQGLGLKPKLVGCKMPRCEQRQGAGAFPFDDEGAE